MKYTITFLLVICALNMSAQTNFNKTMFFGPFGYSIKYINPNNYIHDTMPNKMLALFAFGSASICDSNGNLLIISNGMNLYNGNVSAYIENGDTLASPDYFADRAGHDPYTQTCLILPFSQKKYYYVQVSTSDTQLYKALNINNDLRMDRLYYSIIDMNMNSGQGKVVERMKTLIDNKYLQRTAMQACKHANGKDWWVLKIGADSVLGYTVYKYLFTQDTVYDMGMQLLNSSYKGDWGGGQMQFNKTGDKWACSLGNTVDGEVFLADFDRCTGVLSNVSQINVLPEMGIPPTYSGLDSVNTGICFSPNGNLLYVSRALHIVQYNLQTNTQYKVYGPDTTAVQFALYVKLSVGPDSKVYINNYSGFTQQLSTIDSPDVIGIGCNFCRKCVRAVGVSNYINPMADMPNYDLGVLQPCWPLTTEEIEKRNEELEVYPNPISTLLYIKTASKEKRELYSSIGQLLLITKANEIDVRKLAKGMYYLRCGSETRKVVIE